MNEEKYMTYLQENNLQEYCANTRGKYIVVFIFSLFLQLYSVCVSPNMWCGYLRFIQVLGY